MILKKKKKKPSVLSDHFEFCFWTLLHVFLRGLFVFIGRRRTATMRITLIGFLVLVMGAAVKAHIHFIRLALLAAMGLAGMWMMHKLAQDWQKISSRPKPAAMAGKLLGLWKRSIDETVPKRLFFYYLTFFAHSVV